LPKYEATLQASAPPPPNTPINTNG
jgi:hypothetical protein